MVERLVNHGLALSGPVEVSVYIDDWSCLFSSIDGDVAGPPQNPECEFECRWLLELDRVRGAVLTPIVNLLLKLDLCLVYGRGHRAADVEVGIQRVVASRADVSFYLSD